MAKKKSPPTPEEEQELLEQTNSTTEGSADDSNTPAEEIFPDVTAPQDDSPPADSPPADVASAGNHPDADATEAAPPAVHEASTEGLPVEDAAGDASEVSYDDLLNELERSPLTEDGSLSAPNAAASDEIAEEDVHTPADLLLLPEAETRESSEPVTEGFGAEPTQQSKHSAPENEVTRQGRVLTIDARTEIRTEEDLEATAWHEVQNAYRTRRILTGTLDGVEKTESGLTLAVVNYKGFRVAIPLKEMLLYTERFPSGRAYVELMERLNRMLAARLGAEIDFIVKGIHNDSRSIVASRKDAMYRKRQIFYIDTDELGEHMIYDGRVVQARVVAVAEKVIRVEVFGVECSIRAQGLSWEWVGNARDHFSVGDRILVRVLRIDRQSVEKLSIQADVRSVSSTTSHDNLKKCMPQCRYAGRVTDVRNGVVFIRLNNGVNAIAHSCYDLRTPGKKDDVSFAVTRLDEEQGVAVGIITRIIKQNL